MKTTIRNISVMISLILATPSVFASSSAAYEFTHFKEQVSECHYFGYQGKCSICSMISESGFSTSSDLGCLGQPQTGSSKFSFPEQDEYRNSTLDGPLDQGKSSWSRFSTVSTALAKVLSYILSPSPLEVENDHFYAALQRYSQHMKEVDQSLVQNANARNERLKTIQGQLQDHLADYAQRFSFKTATLQMAQAKVIQKPSSETAEDSPEKRLMNRFFSRGLRSAEAGKAIPPENLSPDGISILGTYDSIFKAKTTSNETRAQSMIKQESARLQKSYVTQEATKAQEILDQASRWAERKTYTSDQVAERLLSEAKSLRYHAEGYDHLDQVPLSPLSDQVKHFEQATARAGQILSQADAMGTLATSHSELRSISKVILEDAKGLANQGDVGEAADEAAVSESFANSAVDPTATGIEQLQAARAYVQTKTLVRDARGLLNQDEIQSKLNPGITAQIEKSITRSERVSRAAAILSQSPQSLVIGQFLSNFSEDTLTGTINFLSGVRQGAFHSIKETTAAFMELSVHPGKILDGAKKLAGVLVHPIESAYAISEAADQYIIKIRNAATAEEQGIITGEFLGQVAVMAVTNGAVSSGLTLAKEAMKDVAKSAVGMTIAKTCASTVESADSARLASNLTHATEEFAAQLEAYAREQKLTIGKTALISEFRTGFSYFIRSQSYDDFVEKGGVLGASDGLYVTSREAADNLVKLAGGNAETFEKKLGFSPGSLFGKELRRIDLDFKFDYLPRLPSGLESTANQYFKYGGFTSGGMPELVLKQLKRTEIVRDVSLGVLK